MRRLTSISMLALAPALSAAAAPAVLHLRPGGPIATLEQARDAVRALKRQPGAEPVTVLVHGGVYHMSQPVHFGAEDSGAIYAAAPKEHPVFSGARPITGWKLVTVGARKMWTADIPDVRAGKWMFHQLWIGGERRQRARHPNQGFFRVTSVPGLERGASTQIGQDRFQFAPGQIAPYANPEDVDVVVMTLWLSNRLGIAGIDSAANIVTLSRPTYKRMTDGFGIKPNLARFYVENALELLDSPGEWYLDRKAGSLYYMPMPGEDMRKVEAVAPALESFLVLDGAENLTFRGLAFEYAEWWMPREDATTRYDRSYQRQGSVLTPAAIELANSRACSFEACTVAHINQYAMHFSRNCERDRVTHCEMFDLGTGGVKVGDIDAREAAHHIEVSDNHIHHGGLTTHSSHAVWIGQSHDNLVAHNHIHDFYYIAVSAGWSWGYSQPWARGNVIEYNHIHHIGKGVLNDMGAIYTLGAQPGTVIRYNVLHDIECSDYGASGIYFDMASAGIVAEKNLVYRTSTGGFHQNYGKDNIVRNNIFVLGRASQIELGSNPGLLPGPNQYLFERNIVYWPPDANFLASAWNNTDVVLRKNLYWHDGTEPKFGRLTWDQWRARKLDEGTIVCDPLFVNPARDDYRLKAESPAFQLGFEPFDLSQAGPRK